MMSVQKRERGRERERERKRKSIKKERDCDVYPSSYYLKEEKEEENKQKKKQERQTFSLIRFLSSECFQKIKLQIALHAKYTFER